jgi:hypothetical protein
VGADYRQVGAESLERKTLEAGLADRVLSLPIGMAAIAQHTPDRADGELDSPQPGAPWRGHVFDEYELAARPKDALDAPDHRRGIGNAAQDERADHRIDREVLDIRRFERLSPQIELDASIAGSAAKMTVHERVGLDGDVTANIARQVLDVDAGAGADLQHGAAALAGIPQQAGFPAAHETFISSSAMRQHAGAQTLPEPSPSRWRGTRLPATTIPAPLIRCHRHTRAYTRPRDTAADFLSMRSCPAGYAPGYERAQNMVRGTGCGPMIEQNARGSMSLTTPDTPHLPPSPATPAAPPSPSASPASSDPVIASGVCYALFAYDVGFGIDLELAAPLLRDLMHRETVKHQRPTPRYFNYQPAPIRIAATAHPRLADGSPMAPLTIAGFEISPRIEAIIFDFGAISITYHIPLRGPLSGLLPLASELYENPVLLEDSRRRVVDLLAVIQAAVTRPAIADFVEDYSIFQIAAFEPPPSHASPGSAPGEGAASIIASNRQRIAQILRSETQPLSSQEIDDALASRIAYTPGEEVIIDWNAAILLQKDTEDIRAVLEYANVELLELRLLDDQLDKVLDRSFEALRPPSWRTDGETKRGRLRWRRGFPLVPDTEIRRIARLQMDSALLFEGVNNALKLIGDQYLARVYRLAAQRFHLPEWDASILRKLQTAESIYQKLSDRASTMRLEVLEWIIIILIAVSIALML